MRTQNVNAMCPDCDPTLQTRQPMTVTIDPPNEPTITCNDCDYSVTLPDYNAIRRQVAEANCRLKYPDMYPE